LQRRRRKPARNRGFDPGKLMLAVLPFENLSEERTQEYFMTDLPRR